MNHHYIKRNILCRLMAVVFAIIAAAGVLGAPVSAKEFEDVTSKYPYSKAIDVLSSLGIFDGMEDGQFHPDSKLTRAEFAAIVIRALKLENAAQASESGGNFVDVENHWARGYINLAAQSGYVSGMDNTHFNPDDNITFEQAIKVLVCITGFQSYAELQGGYPSGYIKVASDSEITKNISMSGSAELDRGQTAQLLFDTMNADMLKSSGTVKLGYETMQRDGTLMDEFSDYADEKGIVSSVGSTSIDGQAGTSQNDYVVIRTESGDLRANTGKTDAAELLGREVRFYTDASEDNDYTLLYIKPTGNNKTLSISSEDLDDVTPEKSYSYYVGGKSKKANLDENVSYIYNGEYAEELTDAELLPKDGSVMLLDNDSDGKYDVVFINDYQHLLVSDYRVKDGVAKLYFKPNAKITMGQLEIDPNDHSSIVTIYRDGEIIVPDENTVINKWTVASVAQSKSKDTTIVNLSDKSISGRVDGISDDVGGKQYIIDGVKYYLAGTFNDNVELGDYQTFQISFNGRIAGVNTDVSMTSADYALVMRTSYDSNEEIGYIKLLHSDGTIVVHEVTGSLIINNVKIKSLNEAVLRTLDIHSLIRFNEEGDGRIRKVETANKKNVCTTTNGYIDYNRDKKFALNASTNLYFNDVNPPTLGGDMRLDGNTLVFDISSKDEDEWGTGDYKLFNDDTVYTVDAYDLDEFKVAGAVVSYGTTVEETESVTWSQSPVLIEKILSTLNYDGEQSLSVIGMQNGERVTLIARDMDVTDDEGNNRLADMTSGSVIQVRCNLRGEITKIRKLYKAPSNRTVYDTMETRDWSGSDYSVNLHTVYGMCMNANENIVTVATRMNDECRAYSITGANIYVYRSKAKTAEKGTVYDIKPGSSYGYDECSRVFMRMEKDMVRDIVIYED